MSDSNGDASQPTVAEMRARARDKSGTDLDRKILEDNVVAAINASERLHLLAKRKLQEQGLAPAVSSGGLTEDDLHQLAVGLVPWVREVLAEATAPLLERLAQLESKRGIAVLGARVAQLEAKPSLQYEGTWNEAKTYSCGALVTFQGGLWHCEDTNMGVRPGAGSSSWKLAVKRGRADR